MTNVSARWQQAAHTTDQLLSRIAAKREPYQKQQQQQKLSLNEKYCRTFQGKCQENGPVREKMTTERAMTVGRTRKEIGKWNQVTALRFQTVGRHQTPPASLRGFREQHEHQNPNEHCISLYTCLSQPSIHTERIPKIKSTGVQRPNVHRTLE